MDSKLRTVARLPLHELWLPDGTIISERQHQLSSQEIAEMLQQGRVHFVIADVGHKLHWVEPRECFDFWKIEVKSRLAEVNEQIFLDHFPDAYCYVASKWTGDVFTEAPVILLEQHH